ncbi:hypothetical protein FJM67_06130 [Maribrevibacterium harenarium]|uniref:Insulinase family protein n=1 Tax=Maribrevibacterium harenarium TaxID=2589817 RepID=A0A501WXJ2_9GAMM|nr:hypothetical protein [Maribrevibacterium harenarium]TPE53979.1 hypothetical protein FJM67_06130 [Maribrevibacterium harenarium]
MLKTDRPLFSRPVLAVIMVASTLAIWLLNMTAPTPRLLIPELSRWQTESGVNLIWLEHADWQEGDKMVISLEFNAPDQGLVTEALLALLLKDSLPLSTATLNQRLTAVATKVTSQHNNERQRFTITVSSREDYFNGAMKTLTTWWQQAQIKPRSLSQWQQQRPQDTAAQQLELLLGSSPSIPVISVDDLQQALSQLCHSLERIVIAGAVPAERKEQIAQALVQAFVVAPILETTTQSKSPLSASTVELGTGHWQQSLGAIMLPPLTTPEQWLALQIWIADALQQQKLTLQADIATWQLVLAPVAPTIQWRVLIPAGQEYDPTLYQRWIDKDKLPSLTDRDAFNRLKEQLQLSLEQHSQDPAWWGTSMLELSRLTGYEAIANELVSALTSLDQATYQRHITQLVTLDSLQQVQVFQ